MQSRLILMVSVIVGSLALGYAARKLRWLPTELSPNITRAAMVWIQPPLLALLIWGLEAPGWRVALLPVLLAVLITVMWPVGALGGRILGLKRAQAGAFTVSCMYSNMGLTYGAFVCFILLGEQGAALGMIWCIAFMPMLYTLGFVVARRYGHDGERSVRETLIDVMREPESRNPLLGLALGGILYALAPARPEVGGAIVDFLVPFSTAIYLFAIGLSLRLTSVVTYWRESAAIGAVKFLVTPVVGLSLAWLAGYWAMEDRTLLQVVFIQSTTPTAIMGLILAQLFDLDEQLANSAWLTTNVAAIALAPLVLYIAAAL
ncbi:MAG: AEC family transporter [Armatimonadota bacterium]